MLLAAWVWQGCHTLLICENLCNLWEAHLSQKVLCVQRILWEYSCSPTDFTDRHRWLGCVGFPTESTESTELLAEKNLPRNSRNPQKLGCAPTIGTGFRPPSDRIPSAVQSDSVRRPIRFRPPSNRIPSAVRSDSVRCPTTWCEEVNREDCAAIHSGFTPCILLCSQN